MRMLYIALISDLINMDSSTQILYKMTLNRLGKNGGLRLSPDQMLGGIQKIVPLPIVKSSSYH